MDTTTNPALDDRQTASLATHLDTYDSPISTPQPASPPALPRPPRVSHGSQRLQPGSNVSIVPETGDTDGEGPATSRARRPVCKYFNSSRGCGSGEICSFRHEVRPIKTSAQVEYTADSSGSNPVASSTHLSKAKAQPQGQNHVPTRTTGVRRPLGGTEQRDQRLHQISQLRLRFSAKEEIKHDGTSIIRLNMPPSDPDFPFDIHALECIVTVPPRQNGTFVPSLRVRNAEMERGYQINVEHGFDSIWQQQQRPTLLDSFKLLDKQLEVLLTGQKAAVIKLVANTTSKPAVSDVATSVPPQDAGGSKERMEAATTRRALETQNLEHRLGRHQLFSKDTSGTLYTLPIEPRKRSELPSELQPVKSIRLHVPEKYDLESCSVELLIPDGSTAKSAVEVAFAQRAEEVEDATLMAQVNYLAQNMHAMVTRRADVAPQSAQSVDFDEHATATSQVAAHGHESLVLDTDKDHVKRVVRPPEWTMQPGPDDEDSTIESEENASDAGNSGSIDYAVQTQGVSPNSFQTGILLRLPDLTLHNIELLELMSLSLKVKCNRCREAHDIHGLKPTQIPLVTPRTSTPSHNTSRTIPCRKCSQPLTASYTPDLLHANTTNAAHLDLDNCEPLDLLPSHFIPTCASCSTTHPPPGISSVRGASDSLAICRGCHSRMLFKFPLVHFLRLGGATAHPSLPRKQSKLPAKEKLGIVAGTPLPLGGSCIHYRKSHRWFRFSCCNKVYPCDKCHDAVPPDPHEPRHTLECANRMICGYCSREQNYRPENCGSCGSSLVGRKGKGFWEGGEGTRDPSKMSRKDPRKRKLATKMRKDRQKAKERNER